MNSQPNYYPQTNNAPYQPIYNYPRPVTTNVPPYSNLSQDDMRNNQFNPVNINQPQPIQLGYNRSQSQYQPQSSQNQRNQIRGQRIVEPQPQRNFQPSAVQNQQSNISSLRVNLSDLRMYKMDGIFAQSFTSLKRQILIHAFVVFVLLFGLLVLYKFDIFKQTQGHMHGVILQDGQLKQSVIPFLIISETLIIIIKLFICSNTYFSLNFALSTANQIGHGAIPQLADSSLSFDENVSQKYLLISTEITYQQGMQENIKKLHKEVTANQIRVCSKSKTFCSSQIHELFEFGLFGLAISLIVVLAQDQTTWLQKLILITTIVYWFIQNYKFIVYTLLLLLCPLIILGVIIYVCITSRAPRRQFTIPQAINPTDQQIVNCGGTCSICMMQFDSSSSVVILPCSDKHMFHQFCIKGWLNLKTTCPNCRFDLAGN